MNRRNFLKALAALVGTTVLPVETTQAIATLKQVELSLGELSADGMMFTVHASTIVTLDDEGRNQDEIVFVPKLSPGRSVLATHVHISPGGWFLPLSRGAITLASGDKVRIFNRPKLGFDS